MTQVAANAFISAASYLLVGVAFALIYGPSRFFNFSQAVIITLAPYATYAISAWLGAPIFAAIAGGILFGVAVASAMELIVYRPMRRKQVSADILMLISLGMYAILHSMIVLIFGSSALFLDTADVVAGRVLLGARLTSIQLLLVPASLLGCLAVWLLLHRTVIGRSIRAVGSDHELALIRGVDYDRTVLIATVIASALAASCGVLLAYDTNLTPFFGFQIYLGGVVAAILGGIGSIPGVALGAILLAVAQHTIAWWFSSAWQDTLVYGVLFLFLIIRPQGFLGTASRRGAV
jgi:branched-subunit amino acid ABC-type transport system permease component